MRLYSYIVRVDSGFAPNPFFGYCTLACCKPVIRRCAKEGDWVVGLTPKRGGNRLLYAMKLTEPPLPFDQYYQDRRFQSKRPRMRSPRVVYQCGDNIYRPEKSSYRQVWSQHSNPDGSEWVDQKGKDLSGKFVLISEQFYYFGRSAKPLPASLTDLVVGRFHKSRFPKELIMKFEGFVSRFDRGIVDLPHIWPADDRSVEEICETAHCKCRSQ